MPPFTSTSWTTALRRAISTARQSVQNKIPPHLSKKALLLLRQKAILSTQTAIHETFPSLSHSTFHPPRLQLQYAPLPPLRQASQRVRMQSFRLGRNVVRGAGIVSSVGIGSARSFSSQGVVDLAANAPMYLRAVSKLEHDRRLRPTPYCSFPRRKYRKSRSSGSSVISQLLYDPASICRVDIGRNDEKSLIQDYPWPSDESSSTRNSSSWDRDYSHYFHDESAISTGISAPLHSSKVEAAPQGTVHPSQLISPNYTATLNIALDPPLEGIIHRLLDQEIVSSRDIGVSVFPNLFAGIPDLSRLHSQHAAQHVGPLLSKLAGLGLFSDQGDLTPFVYTSTQQDGLADTLTIVFPGRSKDDLHALLGETLNGGTWLDVLHTVHLTPTEAADISEQWSSGSATGPPDPPLSSSRSSTERSVSTAPSDSSTQFSRSSSEILDNIPNVTSMSYSYASSTLTPSPSYYPADVASPSSANLIIPTIDVLSRRDSFVDLESTGSIVWSTAPSESDDDLDSIMSDSDVSMIGSLESVSDFGTVPNSPTMMAEQEDLEEVEMEMSWDAGGYGILQPW